MLSVYFPLYVSASVNSCRGGWRYQFSGVQIGRCTPPSRRYLLGVSHKGRRVPRVAGSEGNRSGSHGCCGLGSHLRSGMVLIDDVHVAGRVPARVTSGGGGRVLTSASTVLSAEEIYSACMPHSRNQ